MVSITNGVIEDFTYNKGPVDLALFLKDELDDTYTLLFSANCLDELTPFESTLSVVKYFKSHNDEILKKISSIVVVHSEDDNISTIKNIMNKREDNLFISIDNPLEVFGTLVDDAIILKIQSLATACH